MKQQNFDEFLKTWAWPTGVPTDCTKLENELDCIERNAETLCDSCKAYSLACRDYESYIEREHSQQGSALTPVVAILTVFSVGAVLIAQSGLVNALLARFAQVAR